MVTRKFLNLVFSILIVTSLVVGGSGPVFAQVPAQPSVPGQANGNGNGNGHGNGHMRGTTPAQRKAARVNQAPQQKGTSKTFAGVNPATAAFSPLASGAPALAQMAAPLSKPDVFGVPNWANSPMPTIVVTGTTTTASVGNPLITRAYATDFATPPGTLGPALVVVRNAVLPSGTLQSFQTWNQATPGGSPTPSAGNLFHAYVLRPTGVANQYMVVFDSGLLTVPALPTGNTVGLVQAFPVAPVAVQAGDVIGFYGEGVPVDTGVTVNPDVLSYPAPTAPTAGITITLGVDPGFPIYSVQDRTYSFGATVSVGSTTTTISGGMHKFVDTLPGLSFASSSPVAGNDLGQYIPVAFADTTSFTGTATNPAADY